MKFESAMARNIDTCVQTKHKLLFSIKVKYVGEKDLKKIKKKPNDQSHKEFTVLNALVRMFFNWIVMEFWVLKFWFMRPISVSAIEGHDWQAWKGSPLLSTED